METKEELIERIKCEWHEGHSRSIIRLLETAYIEIERHVLASRFGWRPRQCASCIRHYHNHAYGYHRCAMDWHEADNADKLNVTCQLPVAGREERGMNLNKVYYDGEGNARTILQLVKQEPEWAANIIQFYEDKLKATPELESLVKAREEYLDEKTEVPISANLLIIELEARVKELEGR